ncbi:MAG: glycosyltransferase [Peptococcaceae bacterium]|nr:glycosyltransferase [Peptococcaceae bacterium]
MDVCVYLPCYNEELNITSLIESWRSHSEALAAFGYGLKVFAVDDSSIDATKQRIEAMVDLYDDISLIAHEKNKGLHGVLNTAIAHFFDLGCRENCMVLMDGDNTHDPRFVFDMISRLEQGYDCVIASRYCEGSDVVGLAYHRRFLSEMARHYCRFMLRVPNVQDYTCGYRIYTFDIIERLVGRFGREPIKEKSFACMMEFLYYLHLVGARFGEVSFELRYDYKKGASKMRVFNTMGKSIVVAYLLKKKEAKVDAAND